MTSSGLEGLTGGEGQTCTIRQRHVMGVPLPDDGPGLATVTTWIHDHEREVLCVHGELDRGRTASIAGLQRGPKHDEMDLRLFPLRCCAAVSTDLTSI